MMCHIIIICNCQTLFLSFLSLLLFCYCYFVLVIEIVRSVFLSSMYRLFKLLPDGLNDMAEAFRHQIITCGMEIIEQRVARTKQLSDENKRENPLKEPDFMLAVLSMYQKYYSVVNLQLDRCHLFGKMLARATEKIVNQDHGQHPTSEMLASFCDYLLKGGLKLTDPQVDEMMSNIVRLVGLMFNKDMFMDSYRQHMARRLLDAIIS